MPDSSSSAPESRLLTPTPRSTLNTAAASVEDSTAPQSSAVRQSRSSRKCSAAPTTPMLTSTDTVDSAMPRPSAGRTVRPAGGEAALGQDEDERGEPERLGERGVGELDAQHRLAEHDPDAEVEQQRGQAEPHGHPDRDDADQHDARRDPEQ